MSAAVDVAAAARVKPTPPFVSVASQRAKAAAPAAPASAASGRRDSDIF
jgi:hypothetical protein